MQSAARDHISRARDLESKDQLDGALLEYRKALDMDATNRLAESRAAELERIIRDRIEKSRPKPPIDALRQQARAQSQPLLNPANREPLRITFNNSSLRDVLTTLGELSGITVQFDRQFFTDAAVTARLDGVTIEQALQQVLSANGHFYKVLNQNTIVVAQDNPQAHAKYDELVVRVFYLSHSDPTEISQILNTVLRIPTAPQPAIFPNKTANTLTVRGTATMVDVIDKVIRANDRPRAEVVIDVQILEVNRNRDQGVRAEPEQLRARADVLAGGRAAQHDRTDTADRAAAVQPEHDQPGRQHGRLLPDRADRGGALPRKRHAHEADRQAAAARRRRHRDDAQPRRGDSGHLDGVRRGGVGRLRQHPAVVVQLPSGGRQHRDDPARDLRRGSHPRPDGREQQHRRARSALPARTCRRSDRARSRPACACGKGRATCSPGCCKDDQRKSLTGFPGVVHVPVLRSLFGATADTINQTDIVMLLTPHIVRTHELTADDLAPIYIGTQSNVGLSGPPPLIAPLPDEPPAAAAAAADSRGHSGRSAAWTGAPAGRRRPRCAADEPAGSAWHVRGTELPRRRRPPATPPPAATNPAAAADGRRRSAPAPTPPGDPGAPRDVTQPVAAAAGALPAPRARRRRSSSPPRPRCGSRAGRRPCRCRSTAPSRLSTMTLTVTYNPNVLRVRNVQEGTFMRQGGVTATFTPRIDAVAGRVDIAITRSGDQAGASGTGLLAALLFDAVGTGNAMIQVSGVANTPEGSPVDAPVRPGCRDGAVSRQGGHPMRLQSGATGSPHLPGADSAASRSSSCSW